MMARRIFGNRGARTALTCATLALASTFMCAGTAFAKKPKASPPPAIATSSGSAQEALRPYYAGRLADLPRAGALKPWPEAGQRLSRIAIGSCSKETQAVPALRAAAATRPDLFVYLGDNVYADAVSGEADLPELRQAYKDLAANPDFVALRAVAPVLPAWDDHDYGWNDAGGGFFGKEFAETLFENFWAAPADARSHPGTYYATINGPVGARVQIIVLDTRFFRSPLKTSEGPGGRGRSYVSDDNPSSTILGEAQWQWLGEQLAKPAELRFIMSSIQVLPRDHRFEKWGNFPRERARLAQLLKDRNAKGVVLVSGDRHVAGLYKDADFGPVPVFELTASALNRSLRATSDETDSLLVGTLFAPNNFGLITIDWDRRSLNLAIHDEQGVVQRSQNVSFAELGLS